MALGEGHVMPLLAVLVLLGQGAAEQPLSFTIDQVILSVLPGADVASGTNVTLRCLVQVSHSATQWLLHSFSFLLDQATEVYAKNSSESQVSYSLLPARAAHSGAYSCRVRVLEKERSSAEHRLNVSGLTPPVLTVTPQVIYEGQEVTVVCQAPDEVGTLKFQLDVNGERRREFPSGPDGTPISVKMATPGNMTLRCRMRLLAKPEAGESPSNTVNVTVRELMVTPTMTFEPASGVIEGDFMLVRCAVPTFSQLPWPERGRLEIFLTKDGRILKVASGKAEASYQTRAVMADSGTYVCKTEMQGGNVQKTTSGTTSVAELFSEPEVRVLPLVVFEGDNFTVSCSVSSVALSRIPEPRSGLRYRLLRQGALLQHGQHYTATAGPAHDGTYVCQAEAKDITRNSSALTIKSKVLPSRPIISAEGGVVIGRPFQVCCRADRGTRPITFTLMRGQRSLRSQEVDASSALFNVSAIRERAELAEFSCRAQNDPSRLGLNSPPLAATVIVPISMVTLTLEPFGGGVTEGSDLRLTCGAPRGSPPFTFTFYRLQQGAPGSRQQLLQTLVNGSNRAAHTLRSMQRSQAGQYQCHARNQANDRSSSIAHVHVKLAAWKVALLTVCVILLVAAVGVTLLILIKRSPHPCTHTSRAGELSVKPAKSKGSDPQRVSLVLEEQPPPNATPGMLGRSVWSEHISGSGSDSESQSDEEASVEVQYPQVAPPPPTDTPIATTALTNGTDHEHNKAEITNAALTNGTDTEPTEEEITNADDSAQTEGASIEYVQLYYNDTAPE